MSCLPTALDAEEDADVLGADRVGVVRIAPKLPQRCDVCHDGFPCNTNVGREVLAGPRDTMLEPRPFVRQGAPVGYPPGGASPMLAHCAMMVAEATEEPIVPPMQHVSERMMQSTSRCPSKFKSWKSGCNCVGPEVGKHKPAEARDHRAAPLAENRHCHIAAGSESTRVAQTGRPDCGWYC